MSEVLVLDKDVFRLLGHHYERKNYRFFMEMLEGNSNKYIFCETFDALEHIENVLEQCLSADNPDLLEFKNNTVTDRETLEEHPEAAEINRTYIENYSPNFSGEARQVQDAMRDFPAVVKSHAEGKTMLLEERLSEDGEVTEHTRIIGFFNNIEEMAHFMAKKIGIKNNQRTAGAENG